MPTKTHTRRTVLTKRAALMMMERHSTKSWWTTSKRAPLKKSGSEPSRLCTSPGRRNHRREKEVTTLALRKSIHKVWPGTRTVREQSKRQHGATPGHPLLRLQQSIGNQAVARLIQVKLQKKQAGSEYGEQPPKPTSQRQKGTKAELEFHSALHFNVSFWEWEKIPRL